MCQPITEFSMTGSLKSQKDATVWYQRRRDHLAYRTELRLKSPKVALNHVQQAIHQAPAAATCRLTSSFPQSVFRRNRCSKTTLCQIYCERSREIAPADIVADVQLSVRLPLFKMTKSERVASMTELKVERSEGGSGSTQRHAISEDRMEGEPRSWTPLAAYEAALLCCIQATQSLADLHRKNPNYDVARHRKRIESFEKILTKAYSLVTAEAVQTHTSSPRLGELFTTSSPPSYEQAVSVPSYVDLFGVSTLKEQEQIWRTWWRNLSKGQDSQTPKNRALRELCTKTLYEEKRPKSITVDTDMKQVEHYLEDVERSARKYLQDIDRTISSRDDRDEYHSNVRKRGSLQDPLVWRRAGDTTKQSRSKKRVQGMGEVKADEAWFDKWLSKSLSPKQKRRERSRSFGTTVTTHSSLHSSVTSASYPMSIRCKHSVTTYSEAKVKRSKSHELIPFKPYQVEALFGYEPGYERGFKKGHLSFTAGQIIGVVGIKSRHWLIGSYISKSGKVRSGNVPRGYTVVYHPEIWAIMAESKFTRDRVRLGVRAKTREDRPGAAGVDGPPNRAYDRDHDLPQKLHSVGEWLEREWQDWALFMVVKASKMAQRQGPTLHDVADLIERLDALQVWIKRHRRRGLMMNELSKRGMKLRSKAKRHLLEMQSGAYEWVLTGFP